MPHGYNGKILHVNLTTADLTVEEPEENFYRKYMGGGAMGLHYLLKEMPAGADPLGPEYNAHNAELMTKFTKEYNAPRSADVQTDLDDLTRSNIIGFYKDGIISRATARSMLIDIGFTEAAADIFLDAADYDQIRKERKDLVQLALDLYDSGTITYEEAESRLRSSGLETLEIERALQKLYELSQKRIKWPSMSDAMSFLKRGLISIQDYEGVVKRQGYTEFWIDKYVKQNIKMGEE